MAREQYESEKDRIAEARIAEFYREFNCLDRFVKMPKEFGPDFTMWNYEGAKDRLVEVKNRAPGPARLLGGLEFGHENKFGDRVGKDGYYMARHKVLKAEGLVGSTGLPCFIAVRFNNFHVYSTSIHSYRRDTEVFAGRQDRNDEADMEWEKIYPWEVWEKIGMLMD